MKFHLPAELQRLARLGQGKHSGDIGDLGKRLLDATNSLAARGSAALERAAAGRHGLSDHLAAAFPLPAGPGRPAAQPAEAAPDGAQFLTKTFTGQAGTRSYKLYIPSGYRGQPVPLIVMLHGCTQSPDDFAAGTRMNIAAEAQTCLVAYPGQTSAANMQKCWNWFKPTDQQRGGGEPSLIAGITQEIARDYATDPARIYVAGLSAGGAAAAIMGEAYPELYAAIGVHSGLACGAARDTQSAFAAMQAGADGRIRSDRKHVMPTIVFHGERDTTVHPRNGDAVIAQSVNASVNAVTLRTRVETGRVPGGHSYSRTLHLAEDGTAVVEQWIVNGAGHAWFGGSPAGSYTDPRGPDATGEMMRFFLARENSVHLNSRSSRRT